MTAKKTSIWATYKYVDGWHIFRSDDVVGLYVAHKDAERAYNDVAGSIQLLLKLNEGIDCKVVPELTFKEFLTSLRDHDEEAANDAPLVMSGRRFAVMGMAA